jgi:integrase
MSYITTNESGISKRQLKNGSWVYYASYRDKETQKVKRIKIGGIKEGIQDAFEAKVVFREKQKEESNDEQKSVQSQKKKYTLNDLSELYFAHRYEEVSSQYKMNFSKILNTNVEEDSIYKDKIQAVRAEENRYKNHVKKHDIANKKIQNLTFEDLNEFKKYIVNRKTVKNPRFKKAHKEKDLSSKTKHLIYALCKSIWNFALEKHYIKIENIFNDIGISKLLKNPNEIREGILTNNQRIILLAELKKLKEYNAYYCAKLGFITGARAKTILAIKRKDIDLYGCTITLNNFKANEVYKIPFHESEIDFFEEIFNKHKFEPNEHIIQPQRKAYYKGAPLRNIPIEFYQTVNRLFNQNLEMDNNEHRNKKVINFHSIRHSRLSELVNSGVPSHFVQLFANHASYTSTSRYLKTDVEQMRKQLEKVKHDNVIRREDKHKRAIKRFLDKEEETEHPF